MNYCIVKTHALPPPPPYVVGYPTSYSIIGILYCIQLYIIFLFYTTVYKHIYLYTFFLKKADGILYSSTDDKGQSPSQVRQKK